MHANRSALAGVYARAPSLHRLEQAFHMVHCPAQLLHTDWRRLSTCSMQAGSSPDARPARIGQRGGSKPKSIHRQDLHVKVPEVCSKGAAGVDLEEVACRNGEFARDEVVSRQTQPFLPL
eukprot:1156505-Pelagomonas_calceolata.AAC.2